MGSASNQDFELIGSRFHNWFKDNHENIFGLSSSNDFYHFFKAEFPFYVRWYLEAWDAQVTFNPTMPHLNYIQNWGIAESLQDPLLLAPINFGDSESVIKRKFDFVARYIETFAVRRSVNYRKFGQTAIKYTIFNIIKLIRSNELQKLGKNLTIEVDNIEEKWTGVWEFGLHGMNRNFVKHLLSRITSYLDTVVGKDSNYGMYHHPNGKQFEIEHIWADKFESHKDEFEQETDFQEWRNSLGALILLPQGTNHSFKSDKYEVKLEHYLKENVYAQTLHPTFYAKNPNFLKSETTRQLKFRPHPHFRKDDIGERQRLAQRICEQIWSSDYFKTT